MLNVVPNELVSNVVPLPVSDKIRLVRVGKKIHKLETKVRTLERDNVVLRTRVSELEMENVALRAEISELRKDNEYLKLELKRQGAIIDMLLEDRQQARKPGLLTRLWRFFV